MRKTGIGIVGVLLGFVVGCGAASPASKSPAPEAASAAGSVGAYPGGEEPAAASEGKPSTGPLLAPPAPPPMSVAADSASRKVAEPGGAPAKVASSTVVTSKVATSPVASSTSSPVAIAPAEPRRPLPQSGQLTAGVWDDNRNFDFWKPYASSFARTHGADFAMFAEQELTTARALAAAGHGARAELDVQLVLDTTGSMGDELSFLQSEFDAIASRIRVKFPNVLPRWSLVVYRDKGDQYVTRHFDFTTDTARFRADLLAQSAGGGGDTPEAVVEGLSVGLRQAWRTGDNVARVAFWVADAPAHPGEGPVLANVIREATKKGVHVYPVASSDADDAAEFQMRAAAQMTGGRYVFLTNDSGVGSGHAEPHIPCYAVTRLDTAIVRMVQNELSGSHVAPEQNEVIRTVGRPAKDGTCQLSSGMLVASY